MPLMASFSVWSLLLLVIGYWSLVIGQFAWALDIEY
jgi:hypothetical protein